MNANKKYKMHKFGHDCYLLGQDEFGTNYFLESAEFSCGWYWGGGYVESYTNNNNPARAKDIKSHQHFDGLFYSNPRECGFDAFKKMFVITPFTDSEIWKICELMKSFYTARNYSNMLYCGGAHYTTNPAAEIIKSESEYKRINNEVIPAIMNELYKILGGEEEKQ